MILPKDAALLPAPDVPCADRPTQKALGPRSTLSPPLRATLGTPGDCQSSDQTPRGEIGVVLLGRLAVDQTAQGQGLGKRCLLRTLEKLEALDEQARAWYLALNFGFQAVTDDPNHLILPMDTIRDQNRARSFKIFVSNPLCVVTGHLHRGQAAD